MRVFHFVNEEFGLEDLRRRRLKIATLNELNDPFELFGVNLADESLRRAFRAMKDQLALNRGLLSFSRDWHNLFWAATGFPDTLFRCNDATGGVRWQGDRSARSSSLRR
jgi:hypothetical protein